MNIHMRIVHDNHITYVVDFAKLWVMHGLMTQSELELLGGK